MKSRLLFSALAASLVAGSLQAQTAQTFHACYVPDVGAMYLIQLPGLPTQCLSSGHEEISWTESASGELADGSVTTAKLVDAAVTTAKLGPVSVTAEKIAAGSIGTSQLADGGVTSAKLGSDVSLGGDPADGSITTVKLADGAVTTTKLDPGSVTSDKIAAGAVGSAQLADGSVGTSNIQDGSVAAVKISADVSLPPANCALDQIIKWDGSAWKCSTEGARIYFMRFLKDGTVDFSNLPGITVHNGGTGDYSVTLPIDVSSCAIVGTEELVIMGTNSFLLDFERTPAGFDYHTRRDNAFQDQQLDTNFIIACPG
jgi:hypothetical protein